MKAGIFLFRILREGSSTDCSASFVCEAGINPVWCLSLKSTRSKWTSANLTGGCYPGESHHRKWAREVKLLCSFTRFIF